MTRRYWDSDVFLAWLNREPGRTQICDSILEDAKRGRCEVLTSTVTFTEVYYVKPSTILKEAQIAAIKDLFAHSWIVPVFLDRLTAELARDLLFEFGKSEGLKPKDAIHLASAMRAAVLGKSEVFETWDSGLNNIGTQLHRCRDVRSSSQIRIAEPRGQLRLLEPEADSELAIETATTTEASQAATRSAASKGLARADPRYAR